MSGKISDREWAAMALGFFGALIMILTLVGIVALASSILRLAATS